MKPILRTLIAFANTAGGTLIVGRSDDGTIVGVDDIFAAEEMLANAIADSIEPPLMPEIEIVSSEGKSLLVVQVPYWRGAFFLKNKGLEQGTYIRLGSTNRLAGPELLENLKQSLSRVSFDQLPCFETTIESLDRAQIERVFSRSLEKSKLESLGILVNYAGKLVCSNGGIILFGKEELRHRLFPNATVRCARFRGTEKVDFIDHYDVEGTIVDATREVPGFIRRNTRVAAKIEGIQREDIPEYSEIALREVLVNALVHADYSIGGMNPKIAIFSNRLEIESPGMLPFGFTMEDFTAGVSHIRNKVIARVFRELSLMEEWGTGYKRITEACLKGGYPNPVWEERGMAMRVIFKPHAATHDEIVLVGGEEQLSVRQEKILNLCSGGRPISSKELFANLEEDITERTVRNDLRDLSLRGLVRKVGKGPSTSWKRT